VYPAATYSREFDSSSKSLTERLLRGFLMLSAWAPILIFLTLVTGFALVSVIGSLILGMRKPTPEKLAPYECGMQPVGTARERFSVKFYLVAMLFLLFDIEAVFLFPWAVVYRDLKLFGFFEMVLFIAVVLAGYIYVWKKGALEWER
jgi:NADH-quinone oxidoreductase subunit A